MKTITLTAKSYADLKPFEMMAKRFGVVVGYAEEKPSALEKFTRLAYESRVAAKNVGLVPKDINAAIKKVRKRNGNASCN